MGLKAAKTEAKELYEKLMHQRMEGLRKCYEEEFEHLCLQFEVAQKELDQAQREMKYMRAKMNEQEVKISAFQKMIEGTGNDLIISDDAHDMNTLVEGKDPEEIIEYVIELQEDPLSIELGPRKIYEGAN